MGAFAAGAVLFAVALYLELARRRAHRDLVETRAAHDAAAADAQAARTFARDLVNDAARLAKRAAVCEAALYRCTAKRLRGERRVSATPVLPREVAHAAAAHEVFASGRSFGALVAPRAPRSAWQPLAIRWGLA